MSFVVAAPEAVASAASDLSSLGSSIRSATFAAAPSTTSVVVAAQDEVSAAIAALFGGYGQKFQTLSAQAAAFHEAFVHALSGTGLLYAGAEAANVSPLQSVARNLLSAAAAGHGPVEALTGRPLVGDGTNGAPGTGQAGGDGGWLLGNGGNGGSGAPGQAG
ncbi:PE family protein, partial [Mycobacterium conspicuum]